MSDTQWWSITILGVMGGAALFIGLCFVAATAIVDKARWAIWTIAGVGSAVLTVLVCGAIGVFG